MKSNVSKTCLIAIMFLFSAMVCMQLASAASISYTPAYANVSENFMVNVSIVLNTTLTQNITEIIIKNYLGLPPFAINFSSNQTSLGAGLSNFNISGQNIIWHNLSAVGLTTSSANLTVTIFMNASMAGAPSSHSLLICIYNTTDRTSFATRACDPSDAGFVENLTATVGMNFGFGGYIKNDTGFQLGVNVSIYEYVMSPNSPPSEILLMQTQTDANGLFRLTSVNGSKSLYKVKLLFFNGTKFTEVGSNLPPFPNNMFYPMPPPPGSENMPMFKKMPVINGSTFYMQPAATININALGNNLNSSNKLVQFGYELVDQAVGFPIESNVRNAVSNKEVVVPTGRSYTVIIMRDPNTFLPNYEGLCRLEAGAMNDTACPAPPASMQVTSTNLTQGGYVNISINLSYSMQYLSGCLDVYGNNSIVKITKVITRMVPWEGFVPPMDAKISDFNITPGTGNNNLNYSDPRCPGSWAFYNVSLMGSGNGITYLMEFYARNASDNTETGNDKVDLAMFQNLTMTEASKRMNITLRPLAGSFYGLVSTGSAANTSKMKIKIQNSSGTALTTSMHVEVKVKHPVFGTMHYIIEDLSNGITYLPILANSTWAKISVYPNEAPPVEKTLNLNLIQNNITVQVSEMTFKRPRPDGTLVEINTSKGASTAADTDPFSNISMTFYRNIDGCNTPNPPASCLLTQMNANDFNPMAVMMAGKVNLELKMVASGTTLYFVNFDLLSAKPPTNSIMNNNASGASATTQKQTWEQGSFVPHVYDYAYVVMPYNATAGAVNYINESLSGFNMSLPFLRDENWGVAWNSTNSSPLTSLPDDYSDFNVGAYARLLSSAGVVCNTTNTTDVCYWDKGNNSFVLKVPHFSGVGSSITGLVPTAATVTPETAAASTGSSTGSSTAAAKTESMTFATVYTNRENTYRISDPDTVGFNAVVFTTIEDLSQVKVSVTKLVEKPSSVSESPTGAIYRYYEIDAPKLVGKLKEAKVQFEVPKTWFESNDVDESTVKLARYADGSWKLLTTTKLTENDKKVFYEATTPGFSYFAVVATEKPADEEEAAETPKAPETPTTEELAKAIVEQETAKISKTWLFVAIGVLLALLLAVFGYRKKHLLIFWREPTDDERQHYIRGEFLKRKKQQSFGSGKD